MPPTPWNVFILGARFRVLCLPPPGLDYHTHPSVIQVLYKLKTPIHPTRASYKHCEWGGYAYVLERACPLQGAGRCLSPVSARPCTQNWKVRATKEPGFAACSTARCTAKVVPPPRVPPGCRRGRHTAPLAPFPADCAARTAARPLCDPSGGTRQISPHTPAPCLPKPRAHDPPYSRQRKISGMLTRRRDFFGSRRDGSPNHSGRASFFALRLFSSVIQN